jgi:hypothetical protein
MLKGKLSRIALLPQGPQRTLYPHDQWQTELRHAVTLEIQSKYETAPLRMGRQIISGISYECKDLMPFPRGTQRGGVSKSINLV